MGKDWIAFELMQLHSHLRTAASPHMKAAIRKQIDSLVRESGESPDRHGMEIAELDRQRRDDRPRNSISEKR